MNANSLTERHPFKTRTQILARSKEFLPRADSDTQLKRRIQQSNDSNYGKLNLHGNDSIWSMMMNNSQESPHSNSLVYPISNFDDTKSIDSQTKTRLSCPKQMIQAYPLLRYVHIPRDSASSTDLVTEDSSSDVFSPPNTMSDTLSDYESQMRWSNGPLNTCHSTKDKQTDRIMSNQELKTNVAPVAEEKSDLKNGSITLADYLNQLNEPDHSNSASNLKKLSFLRSPKSLRPFLMAKLGETANLSNSLASPLTVQLVKGEENKNSNIDPSTKINYLIKRRLFIVERLVARYGELLKLLNEELEITGHPPPNYLEYSHAQHEAQEIYKQALKAAQDQSVIEKQSNDNSKQQSPLPPEKSRSTIHPGLPIPTGLRGSRLQETGFMFSPRVIRKASLKLSPSANSLLTRSRLSLYGDEADSDNNSLKKFPVINRSFLNLQPRSQSVSRNYTPFGLDRFAQTRKLSVQNGQHDFGSMTGLTHSQTTQNVPLESATLSNVICAYSSHSLQDLEQDQQLKESRTKCKHMVDQSHVHLAKPLSDNKNTDNSELEEKDYDQAIAWLEVEHNALQNILTANLHCATEPRRSRESRKMYRLAAKQNRESIAKIEVQLDLLRNKKSLETVSKSLSNHRQSIESVKQDHQKQQIEKLSPNTNSSTDRKESKQLVNKMNLRKSNDESSSTSSSSSSSSVVPTIPADVGSTVGTSTVQPFDQLHRNCLTPNSHTFRNLKFKRPQSARNHSLLTSRSNCSFAKTVESAASIENLDFSSHETWKKQSLFSLGRITKFTDMPKSMTSDFHNDSQYHSTPNGSIISENEHGLIESQKFNGSTPSGSNSLNHSIFVQRLIEVSTQTDPIDFGSTLTATSRQDLSIDTGFGTPTVPSSNNDSGTDISHWSILSTDRPTDQPDLNNQSLNVIDYSKEIKLQKTPTEKKPNHSSDLPNSSRPNFPASLSWSATQIVHVPVSNKIEIDIPLPNECGKEKNDQPEPRRRNLDKSESNNQKRIINHPISFYDNEQEGGDPRYNFNQQVHPSTNSSVSYKLIPAQNPELNGPNKKPITDGNFGVPTSADQVVRIKADSSCTVQNNTCHGESPCSKHRSMQKIAMLKQRFVQRPDNRAHPCTTWFEFTDPPQSPLSRSSVRNRDHPAFVTPCSSSQTDSQTLNYSAESSVLSSSGNKTPTRPIPKYLDIDLMTSNRREINQNEDQLKTDSMSVRTNYLIKPGIVRPDPVPGVQHTNHSPYWYVPRDLQSNEAMYPNLVQFRPPRIV